MKENLIQQKSFEFALMAIEVYKLLLQEREFILSKQFLRSSTSIGANIEELLQVIAEKISLPSLVSHPKKQEKHCIG